MPGGFRVDVAYGHSNLAKEFPLPLGTPYFWVSVTVGPAVTAQQVSDAGRTFVERFGGAVGFPGHKVSLEFTDPVPNTSDPGASDSTLQFELTDGAGKRTSLGADDVAATAARWVDIWKFPGVNTVEISQSNAGANSRSIRVTVINDAAGAALARQFPDAAGHWCVYYPGTTC